MKTRNWIVISLTLAVVPLLVPLEGGRGLAPLRKWVMRYHGPGNGDSEAKAMTVDGLGNIYVTGESWGSSTDGDYATIKYGANGKQFWVKRYNGPANGEDFATAIAVDGSGYVYVTGCSFVTSSGAGDDEEPIYDYATVKYGPDGKQLWVNRYNGSGNDNDTAWAIAVDGSGNIYVTGGSVGSGTGADYATIKYNAKGQQLWVNRYNGPANGSDEARAIALDGSGNIYVTGQSWSSGTKDDYTTIKYSANGQQLWVKRYNGPANSWDQANTIAVDGSGNVYVTGRSDGITTLADYATIKYSTNGKKLWARRCNWPDNGYDEARAIAVDASGNVYVTGQSWSSVTEYDYATIKYSANGQQLWENRYNGPYNGFDGAWAIAVDGSGNVYITGESNGSGSVDVDYATIKYNASGKQVWIDRYTGPKNGWDWAWAIAADRWGDVYVTGGSSGDYATIKY